MECEESSCPKNQAGAVMVEQALCISLLLFVLLGIVDIAHAVYVSAASQYAVTRTAHWAAIGSANPGESREESISKYFEDVAQGIGLNPALDKLSICLAVNPGCSVLNAGSANDIIYVSYSHPKHLFSVNLSVELSAGAFARNEPF